MQWVSELTDELMAKSEPTNTTAQWMSSAEVTFMRIEIMIDKEQKISQQYWTLWKLNFTEISSRSIQRPRSVFEKVRQTALS